MALNRRKYRRAFKPNGARIFLAGDASERLEDQTFPHEAAGVATALPRETTLGAVMQLVHGARHRLNARRQLPLPHRPFEHRLLQWRHAGHVDGDGGVGGGGSGVGSFGVGESGDVGGGGSGVGSSGVGESGGVCSSVHLRVQKQRRQQR